MDKNIQLPDPFGDAFNFIGRRPAEKSKPSNASNLNNPSQDSHISKPKKSSNVELSRQTKQELLTSESDSKAACPIEVLESVVEPSLKNYPSTHERIAEAAEKRPLLLYKRVTIILPEGYKDKLDAYAFWSRHSLKDVFQEMCDDFFAKESVKKHLKDFEKHSPEDYREFLKRDT